LTQQDPVKKIQQQKKRKMRQKRCEMKKRKELEAAVATTTILASTPSSHSSTTWTDNGTRTATIVSSASSNSKIKCHSQIAALPTENDGASLPDFDDHNDSPNLAMVIPTKSMLLPPVLDHATSNDLSPIQSLEPQLSMDLNFLSECVSVTDDSKDGDEDSHSNDSESSISAPLWEFHRLSPRHRPTWA
jgi:hypothetical protein